MAKANPKNEAREIGSPNTRVVHPGRTDAVVQLIEPGKKEADERQGESGGQCDVIVGSGFDNRADDVVVNIRIFQLVWFTVHGYPSASTFLR